jgi:hypothetical protein
MSEWIIYTTMRRRWPDGTEFIIRPATPGEPRLMTAINGFQLTLTHPAGLRAHSHHPTVEAAQAHAEELMDTFGDAAPPKPRLPKELWRPGFGVKCDEVAPL